MAQRHRPRKIARRPEVSLAVPTVFLEDQNPDVEIARGKAQTRCASKIIDPAGTGVGRVGGGGRRSGFFTAPVSINSKGSGMEVAVIAGKPIVPPAVPRPSAHRDNDAHVDPARKCHREEFRIASS